MSEQREERTPVQKKVVRSEKVKPAPPLHSQCGCHPELRPFADAPFALTRQAVVRRTEAEWQHREIVQRPARE
eukprot:651985-Prymnesium_polylepis.1